jgi:hypothetical protein
MTFIVLWEADDRDAGKAAVRLVEEGKWYDLGAGWRARADKPHAPNMQPHTHVYLKKDQAFIINRDGTASHGSDLSTMPRRVRDILKDKSLIEAVVADREQVWVPESIIAKAAERIEQSYLVARVLRLLGKH